ncbi:MAG: phosphoribosylformylglycinamidine synthase subunit PurL [Candidatus Omnitrophica bacterium]|nr:phosphoribosylformylglycinamidine synthase subunit PurL [Candidatus Omnitrophota bacterium]
MSTPSSRELGFRAGFATSRGRAGRSCQPRKARGGGVAGGVLRRRRATQRGEANPPSPSGCGGRLPSPASLLLGVSLWIRRRRRSWDPAAWHSQRGSREVAKPALNTQTDWRFVIRTREGFSDPDARKLKEDIADLGIQGVEKVSIVQVYYVGGVLTSQELQQIGEKLLVDSIVQEYEVEAVHPEPPVRPSTGSGRTGESKDFIHSQVVEVAYHPGVRDPVEDSLKKGALDLGIAGLRQVHTAKEYAFAGSLPAEQLTRICDRLLVNATVQQIVTPENLERLLNPPAGSPLSIETVHLMQASDTVLQRVSIDHQLSLNLEEMRAIQAYFRTQKREPTLIELETLAQTWSEHCKHKTLRGPIQYTEEIDGKIQKRTIQNLLKSTIMRATEELNRHGCLSVFEDNSGVIEFDEEFAVCFKVETHNHPSALEPFGGASTGVGGVIRDILGTGLGAKPIASTDVFCFAPPDFPAEKVPPGVLHPRRVIKGVVAGVKDYGNKMGIPTVNGAVLFDDRFVGNPLVYCGNVGLIPKDKVTKQVSPGMQIVLAGGRTGRDGVHGATFSSLALTTESEVVSATAVQIGDPITEKKLADALLLARDQGLFSAVTDCGAGGLSSAVGEMAADSGAKVFLERVPLKYTGLTPAEIWISESQERMVLAVAPADLDRLLNLFREHGVEATAVGEFTDSGWLELFHAGISVGKLEMDFLHGGVPQILRPARWSPPGLKEPEIPVPSDLADCLLKSLSRWETCSKEWIIRQYDHEVQGGSSLKPLVGVANQGPSDAAVVRPRLDSPRGVVLSNGINFRYGDIDPYWMALLAVEEALRQIVAVGGSLESVAILDNFCWGDPTRPEVLGSLVRAAQGCYDAAKAFGVPFISGKDSLHNEYRVGEKVIPIPGTLLISAIGIVADAARLVSMDAKKAGSRLYLVGSTKPELGGSSYYASLGFLGASVPQVDLAQSPLLMSAVSRAIGQGLAVSAHDCSEGGLAVAAAEMAFAGGLGLTLELEKVPRPTTLTREDFILFSESPTRFLLEVPEEKSADFERALAGFPLGKIGQFQKEPVFRVIGLGGQSVIDVAVEVLQEAWQAPFKGW